MGVGGRSLTVFLAAIILGLVASEQDVRRHVVAMMPPVSPIPSPRTPLRSAAPEHQPRRRDVSAMAEDERSAPVSPRAPTAKAPRHFPPIAFKWARTASAVGGGGGASGWRS
jgi:hypothetical protein